MEEQQLAWSVFLLEADMYAMLDGVWHIEHVSENCALNSDHCQTSPTYLIGGVAPAAAACHDHDPLARTLQHHSARPLYHRGQCASQGAF